MYISSTVTIGVEDATISIMNPVQAGGALDSVHAFVTETLALDTPTAYPGAMEILQTTDGLTSLVLVVTFVALLVFGVGPSGDTSSAFNFDPATAPLAVGDGVKSRYRGKAKSYPGVIARCNEDDGTYDVDYGEFGTRQQG